MLRPNRERSQHYGGPAWRAGYCGHAEHALRVPLDRATRWLLLNVLVGWWWADPAAALVIAGVAAKEGRESWRGDSCECCWEARIDHCRLGSPAAAVIEQDSRRAPPRIRCGPVLNDGESGRSLLAEREFAVLLDDAPSAPTRQAPHPEGDPTSEAARLAHQEERVCKRRLRLVDVEGHLARDQVSPDTGRGCRSNCPQAALRRRMLRGRPRSARTTAAFAVLQT